MFACLMIVSELAILYTVFWYIFLRETKPYRISGNPWGHYEGHDKGTKLLHRADFSHDLEEPKPDWMRLEQHRLEQILDHERDTNKTRLYEIKASSKRGELPKIARNPALKYGWEMNEKPPTKLTKLLLGFKDTIHQLCFKAT